MHENAQTVCTQRETDGAAARASTPHGPRRLRPFCTRVYGLSFPDVRDSLCMSYRLQALEKYRKSTIEHGKPLPQSISILVHVLSPSLHMCVSTRTHTCAHIHTCAHTQSSLYSTLQFAGHFVINVRVMGLHPSGRVSSCPGTCGDPIPGAQAPPTSVGESGLCSVCSLLTLLGGPRPQKSLGLVIQCRCKGSRKGNPGKYEMSASRGRESEWAWGCCLDLEGGRCLLVREMGACWRRQHSLCWRKRGAPVGV